MQSNLYRLVVVTLLLLLVTSCSSVESEPEGFWNGVWRYQSASTIMEARLTQEGDQVTGTIENVRDGGQFHQTYGVEATANDTLATGYLIIYEPHPGWPSGPREHRSPMHLVREGDAILVSLGELSWVPRLQKVQG